MASPMPIGPRQVLATHAPAMGSEARVHLFLSFLMGGAWPVPASQLYPPTPDTETLFAVKAFDDSGRTRCDHGADALASGCLDALVKLASAEHTLFVVPMSDRSNVTGGSDYRPTLTAAWPVCRASGWVLLGELDKYVPLSPQRFAATACTEHGVSATVCGAAGEAGIVLTALRPSMADGQPAPAREVVSQKVTLPEQGGCVTVALPSPMEVVEEQEVHATTLPGCRDDFDCSYNGECVTVGKDFKRCVCQHGWRGAACEQLDLLPAANGTGLDLLRGASPPMSTWGGSVLRADDGRYHGWFSLVTRSCGIHRWLSNSVVVHATADSPLGPFTKKETVFGLFSHEPAAQRAPSGEYVLFFTSYHGAATDAPTCNCSDGSSASGEQGCEHEPGRGKNKTLFSYMAWATSPDGPWSEPVVLSSKALDPQGTVDTNLSPVIMKDGSLLAWTRWDVWTASNWKDPKTYRDTGQAPAWINMTFWEGEDPFVYRDAKGRWHMISHNGERGAGGTAAQPAGDCGRHWYSATGAAGSWNAAVVRDNALLNESALGGCAFPRVNVTFSDGSLRSFYRRERPHLIFGADGVTPVALLTAVIDSSIGPGMPGYQGPQRDASYTLVQPIAHQKRPSASGPVAASGGLPAPLHMLMTAAFAFHDCVQPKGRDRRPPNVRAAHPLSSSAPPPPDAAGCSGGLCLGMHGGPHEGGPAAYPVGDAATGFTSVYATMTVPEPPAAIDGITYCGQTYGPNRTLAACRSMLLTFGPHNVTRHLDGHLLW